MRLLPELSVPGSRVDLLAVDALLSLFRLLGVPSPTLSLTISPMVMMIVAVVAVVVSLVPGA